MRKNSALRANTWKSTLLLIVGSVAAMLVLQAWFAVGVVNRSTELRAVLLNAHSAANQLERRIGYGGLIHHFKNYVLRPDEKHYRVLALTDASDASVLLDELRTSAERIGINSSLANTREMLAGYTQRLEAVRMLSANGLSPALVDEQVRFNDRPALQEVWKLLEALDAAFEDRISELQHQGIVTSMMSTGGTAALGLLLIGIVTRWQRRQQRQHRELSSVADSLVESNDDLARLNTSLSQFAGIVSHDLKSPVRNINALNQMIAEDSGGAPEIKQHVERIENQVQQMDSIIDSLLEFTQYGFARPQTEAVDVSRLFADVQDTLPPETAQAGAHIEFKAELTMPVMVDPRLMSRVFSNLIGNSLKYTRADESASIVVHAQSDGQRALFFITDNGIGIDARFAQKIFEPMMRLHGPQSHYKGVGIGLSLVKTIIESHGGAIWLDTEFTTGTRIVFTLPIAPYDELREAA